MFSEDDLEAGIGVSASASSSNRGLQPWSLVPIPFARAQGIGVAVDEADIAAFVMAQVRAAPIRIEIGRNAADAGRVLVRIVHNPATRFVR